MINNIMFFYMIYQALQLQYHQALSAVSVAGYDALVSCFLQIPWRSSCRCIDSRAFVDSGLIKGVNLQLNARVLYLRKLGVLAY